MSLDAGLAPLANSTCGTVNASFHKVKTLFFDRKAAFVRGASASRDSAGERGSRAADGQEPAR
jgi:hypothetical protein